jgi:hypothetical protein
VNLVEKFRRTAAECFRWAQDARTQGDNAMWLGMAQFWLQLAQHAEQREERGAASPAPSNKPQHDGTDGGNEAPPA